MLRMLGTFMLPLAWSMYAQVQSSAIAGMKRDIMKK